MDDALFKAILSMDAYNRGYDAGIVFGNNPGDNSYSLDNPGTMLGTATISANRGQDDAQDIGFYALAYDTDGDGDADVISYRGTDDVDGIPNPLTDKDVYHGWSLGGGNTASEQGLMALEFYQDVAGDGNWLTANIDLTGHSLGGGLAGYVGAL